MTKRTGLTREQRDEVRPLVTALANGDGQVRREARERLLVLSEEMPVFQYLDASLPYSRGVRVPEMMGLMTRLEPERSKNMLLMQCQDANPMNRAKAVALIGAVMKEEGVERVAQGLVDHDAAVRISAAHTLGDLGDARVSYALLEGLASDEARERNSCGNALSKRWSSQTTRVEFASAQEWKAYLGNQSAAVSNAIDLNSLTPLVVPDPEGGMPEYVEE